SDLSAFSFPVPRTTSEKKDAPRDFRNANISLAAGLRLRSTPSCSCPRIEDIQSDSSRRKKVTGATLVGTTRRLPLPLLSSVAGCGESLPQATAPVRQS